MIRLVVPRLILCTLFSPSIANAYPMNPWGARVPDRTIAINPYLYAYPGPTFTGIGYGAYGFANRFDVYAGIAVDAAAPEDGGVLSIGTFELMPRVFVIPELAFSPHLFYTPGGAFTPAPEAHFAKNWGRFALTANLAWRPEFGTTPDHDEFNPGSLVALLAPEVYFGERASLFLELDPTLSLTSVEDTTLTLAPGIWWALDAKQKHSFAACLHMTVPATGGIETTLSPGVWYATSFGMD